MTEKQRKEIENKSEARKRLDAYIDSCIDCDGVQTGEKYCQNCQTFFNAIKVVREIREERKEKAACTGI